GAPTQARAAPPSPFANYLPLAAGVIHDIAGRIDLVARSRDFVLEGRRAGACGPEQRKRSRRSANGGARFADRIEEPGECQETHRLERTSLHGKRLEDPRQISRVLEGELRVARQVLRCFRGGGEETRDPLRVR